VCLFFLTSSEYGGGGDGDSDDEYGVEYGGGDDAYDDVALVATVTVAAKVLM